MGHYGIPWPAVRWLYRNIRSRFFTVTPPDQRHLLTSASIQEIQEVLGKSHFAESWPLSYNYYSEDMNMRRPDYNVADPERPWYQTHVRGFLQESGDLKLMAHYEYCPIAYPEAHLHNENLSVDYGIRNLKEILDDYEISYREVSP